MKSNDEGKEARKTESKQQNRIFIPILCLLMIILVGCALYLAHWGRSKAVSAAATPAPATTVPMRTYVSKFAQTPVPTLPAPYLDSPAPATLPGASPTSAPTPAGLLGGKYSWRFSDKEVLTDHTYSNPTVSISWDMYRDEINYNRPVTFFVADILVQDISSLRTAFAKKEYLLGGIKSMEEISKSNDCIIAISGDFARWHDNGIIVRNGELFRSLRLTSDLCVLYRDGTMETYEPGSVTNQEIFEKDIWQSWHFGPELLDHDGLPKTKFNSTVLGNNPRSVIGYYEPGHYCFVLVDGRQGTYSGGLNMQELSVLMYTLGCVRAYNLDGGATAHMTWCGELVNSPKNSRKLHDVICVCFPTKE